MKLQPSKLAAVNVSAVPHRSPLRYPGGKTWLVPHVREWLSKASADVLIDPFVGGGIVPLTAVMEGSIKRCEMFELDKDVAAFWQDALYHTNAMIRRIQQFQPTLESVTALEQQKSSGFRTLVLNRTRISGILAPGASFIKNGDGDGIRSRWYPETLIRRLQDLAKHADRLTFRKGDGMRSLEFLPSASNVVVFVDPPYTAGGKRAGARLYAHSNIDHSKLFEILASLDVDFLMTYDCVPEIVDLIRRHRFHAVSVHMKNAHHNKVLEMIITRKKLF